MAGDDAHSLVGLEAPPRSEIEREIGSARVDRSKERAHAHRQEALPQRTGEPAALDERAAIHDQCRETGARIDLACPKRSNEEPARRARQDLGRILRPGAEKCARHARQGKIAVARTPSMTI